MHTPDRLLNPSEAARSLGVSTKALRLYEQRRLIAPQRSEAGWRVYGPEEMTRAGEIVALRNLGLSLAQVARVLKGDPRSLEPALATHQGAMEARARDLTNMIARIRTVRRELAQGVAPSNDMLSGLLAPAAKPRVAFDLAWPWGGERFEMREVEQLTYIVGPLGSGKTRFAMQLAQTLPGARFLGLDRLKATATRTSALDEIVARLVDDGAIESDALVVLLAELSSDGTGAMVIDMVEQGLDQPTQEVLIDYLRHRPADSRPLFVLTRSTAILDLEAVGASEAVYLCPANHSPPQRVLPYPGAPGYEAVATCLASPEVRARTAGVVVARPAAA